MQRVFVDTGGWYELVNDRGNDHARFLDWFGRFEGRLVTSTSVFDETISLVKKKLGHRTAEAVGERLRDPDAVHMVSVDEGFRELGWELFVSRPDKGYSLVDASSFVIMERMGIKRAAATDDHFRQEGFELVPG